MTYIVTTTAAGRARRQLEMQILRPEIGLRMTARPAVAVPVADCPIMALADVAMAFANVVEFLVLWKAGEPRREQ